VSVIVDNDFRRHTRRQRY